MSLPTTYVEGFHDKESVLQMEYNQLGNTGLKVSKLSFGCGPFGGNVSYGIFDEEEAVKTLREAIRKGINYIDTAPAYGQGNSERVLGKALAGIPREAYYVSTKVSRYGANWGDMFDRSEERILTEFDNSLKLLGLDYVDIVYVHDIEFSPMYEIINKAIPAATKLVNSKKARHLGISAYPISVLREAIEKSTAPIEVVLTYSRDLIFDHTLQEYIPFFKSKGIGVVNAAITGMGILTKEGPPAWHPADTELKAICKSAAEFTETKGVELSKLSVGHSLQQPGADTYLVGMNTKAVLQKNLNTLEEGLSEKERDILKEVKEKFFNSNKNLHWEGTEVSRYKKYLESEKTN